MRKARTRERNVVQDLGGWEGDEVAEVAEVTEVAEVQSSSPSCVLGRAADVQRGTEISWLLKARSGCSPKDSQREIQVSLGVLGSVFLFF